jgi:hypothetical protein
VDSRLTYLTVDEQGVRIHEYKQRADDRDSGQERGESDLDISELEDESRVPAEAEFESVGG